MRERLERMLGRNGARDLDPHLPRRLRPDAAARGGAARLPLDLHDLRRPGSGAAREGVPRGARQGSEALLAARHPLADLAREERARLPRRVRAARRLVLGSDRRRGVRALPAPPPRLERRRLRRHAHAHGGGPRALPRGARALAQGVPLRPRRRVPGHEPRAVPAPPAPRRRARERLRGRRSRSVDLRVPRRRHPQHPRVREDFPARRSSRSSRTTARRTRSSARRTR